MKKPKVIGFNLTDENILFMRSIFLVSLFGFILMACSNRSERPAALTTEIIEVWEDGLPKIVRLYNLEDGKKIAMKEIHYYPDGQKHIEGTLSGDKRHGVWKSSYKNGALWSEGAFQNGVRHGKGIVYHANGNKFIEGSYFEGQRSGKLSWWNEDGQSITEQEAVQLAPEAEY